ncbi:hypothetical protein P9112_014164 [Eukaryota sp. TZLM1-RC]
MASLCSSGHGSRISKLSSLQSRTRRSLQSLDVQSFRRGNEANFVRSIMLDLSPQDLATIRELLLQNEVNMPMFVVIMKHHLSDDFKNSFAPYQLELSLVQLFLEIDVNGDNQLESDEFSAYVASTIAISASSDANMRLKCLPSTRTTGITISRASLSSIVYVDAPASRFFASLDNSPTVLAWQPFSVSQLDPFTDDINPSLSAPVTTFSAHMAPCTALCALSRNKHLSWSWLATGSTDRYVALWDAVTLVERARVLCSAPVLSLCQVFSEDSESYSLAVGTSSAEAFLLSLPNLTPLIRLTTVPSPSDLPVQSVYWAFKDVDHEEEETNSLDKSLLALSPGDKLLDRRTGFAAFQTSRANPVTSMVNATSLKLVICGFQDGSLLWFDILSGEFRGGIDKSKSETNEGHSQAIFSLIWSDKARVAVSLSYQRYALGYNCKGSSHVFKLGGGHFHLSPIVSQCLLGSGGNYCATFDLEKTCCIWNLSTLECVQVLQTSISVVSAISVSEYVVTCSSGPLCPLQAMSRAPPLLEDKSAYHRVLSILFSDSLLNFISLCPKAVFSWDSVTGTKVNEWHFAPNDAISMIFDDRERKLLVGLSNGHIQVLNVTNGSLLKTLKPIDPDTNNQLAVDLVSISFAPELRYAVAFYLNSLVVFFEENDDSEELFPLFTLTIPSEPTISTCLETVVESLSSGDHLPFFVVGTISGEIFGFDSLSFNLLNKGAPLLSHPASITALLYVATGFLLSCDDHGNVVLSEVRGSRDSSPLVPVRLILACECPFPVVNSGNLDEKIPHPAASLQSIALSCASKASNSINFGTVSKDFSLFVFTTRNGDLYIIDLEEIKSYNKFKDLQEPETVHFPGISDRLPFSTLVSGRPVSLINVNNFVCGHLNIENLFKFSVMSIMVFSNPKILVFGPDSSPELHITSFDGTLIGKTSAGSPNLWNLELNFEYFLQTQRIIFFETLEATSDLSYQQMNGAETPIQFKLSQSKRRTSRQESSRQSSRGLIRSNRLKELSVPSKYKQTKIYKDFDEANPKVSGLVNKIESMFADGKL